MRSAARVWLRIAALVPLMIGGAPLFGAESSDDDRESYSYVRVLEGRATLASAGAGPGEDAEVNQPLLSGDRVQVARGASVEIVLADRNVLRVGGDTSLTLTRIAFSGDRSDRSTRLDLDFGEILLVVGEDALGDELPEVRTPGGDVVIHQPGTYRIESDASGWTELVVREGFAEVATRQGSTVVRAGESAVVDGDRASAVQLAEAGPEDALERWGADLSERALAARQEVLHVEPSLSYAAAPLADWGAWVYVDSVAYWRPRVATGWRPYSSGRWGWTPSGLTWVSYEPWGWVPYHYGTWCQVPSYGWMWRPGYHYAPAWVYWHWSSDWIGWCPTGYYTGWYGSSWGSPWFRHGYYGWAGGYWSSYNDWCFVPARRVCDRDGRRWHRRGHDLGRELGGQVPNGVVTTTTRDLPRRFFERPNETFVDLRRRAREASGGVEMDVTDFVARKRDLPPEVVHAVASGPNDRNRLPKIDRGTERPAGAGVGQRPSRPWAEGAPGTDARRPTVNVDRGGRGGAVRDDSAGNDGVRIAGARPTPRTGTAGPDLDSTPRGERPPVAADRQGWRTGGGTATSRPLPREPGDRVRIDPRGGTERRDVGEPAGASDRQPRGRPAVGDDDSSTSIRPRTLPPARVQPTDAGRDRPVVVDGARSGSRDDRQSWRSREPGASGSTPASPAVPRPSARSGEPVRRVVDGVRRYEPVYPDRGGPTAASPTWRSDGSSARPQPRTWRPPSSGSAPSSRPTYTPPAGRPAYSAPSRPGGSAPRWTPTSPRPSSTPRATSPSPSGGSRSGPAAGSAPSSGSRSGASSSSGSRSSSSGHGGSSPRSSGGGSSSHRDPPRQR